MGVVKGGNTVRLKNFVHVARLHIAYCVIGTYGPDQALVEA